MKTIETYYGGYKFRSRLEARWAVFFDALHVPYQYEPEGYELEGVYYLPDFWLPQQECWVEIKGHEPTEEERKKVRLLSWYTEKEACIFHGEVWKPANPEESHIERISKIEVSAGVGIGNLWPKTLTLSPDLTVMLLKMQRLGVTLAFFPYHNLPYEKYTLFASPCSWMQSHPLKDFLGEIERQQRELATLFEEVEQRKQEILAQTSDFFAEEEVNVNLIVQGGGSTYCHEWMVCKHCKRAHIHRLIDCEYVCPCLRQRCQGEGDEEYLHAAYLAARQARFEYR